MISAGGIKCVRHDTFPCVTENSGTTLLVIQIGGSTCWI